MAAGDKKNVADKVAEPARPVLVPQPHGGALLSGGVPGHAPGISPGRPPSAIRQRLRGSFEQRIAVIEEIADSKEATAPDRIKAIDLLAKYGLGTLKELSTDEVRDRLRETIAILKANLLHEDAERVISLMEPVWKK